MTATHDPLCFKSSPDYFPTVAFDGIPFPCDCPLIAQVRDQIVRGLRREAEVARRAPQGHHPELQTWTDSATIRLMARKIEKGELR